MTFCPFAREIQRPQNCGDIHTDRLAGSGHLKTCKSIKNIFTNPILPSYVYIEESKKKKYWNTKVDGFQNADKSDQRTRLKLLSDLFAYQI